MTNYKHTQLGKLTLAALGGASVVIAILGLTATPTTFFVLPILLFAAWLFHSLTIEVNEEQLRWHFGSGIIHRRVARSEIASVERVRTNVIEGWGIHWSRFGWLYNVSGFDAVAITLRSGKRFALGTDDAEGLLSALRQ